MTGMLFLPSMRKAEKATVLPSSEKSMLRSSS